MTSLARSIAAAIISIAVIALPQPSAASSLVRRAEAPDFAAYLPPMNDVPWLTLRTSSPKTSTSLPEAGTARALLFVPTPR